MRKKIFAALVVAVGVGFAGYNVMQTQKDKDALSDLLIANVEALADDEAPSGYSCSVSRDCGGGATVSCTGTQKCEHVSGPLGSIAGRGVKCDGKTTTCP